MSTILHLSHLTKSFGTIRAVDDLSLDVYAGEIFGFLGPNGAGKTTTISMICGLLKPDAGDVVLNGVDQVAANPGRSRIGVCPQSIILWERLTCLESLEFIGEMYGVPRAEARKRGLALLETLGLAEKQNRLSGTLSGGMQRRLNLALALVHDPDLLVLDEPEAGLDPQSRVMVREYIHAWAHARPGRTVIFTTHNMDEAERLVDRVGIIDQGRLLVLDTPSALKRDFGAGDILEILVQTNGCPPDGVLSALGELAASSRFSGDLLTVHCAAAVETLPLVLKRLAAANVTPAEVRIRANTLEDVFIALTGRRLRE